MISAVAMLLTAAAPAGATNELRDDCGWCRRFLLVAGGGAHRAPLKQLST
jgi:hypothetical protein